MSELLEIKNRIAALIADKQRLEKQVSDMSAFLDLFQQWDEEKMALVRSARFTELKNMLRKIRR